MYHMVLLKKSKNGYFMCSKYESKPIIRNSPHVFIFANFEPDVKELSLDRWNVVKLNNEIEETPVLDLDIYLDI